MVRAAKTAEGTTDSSLDPARTSGPSCCRPSCAGLYQTDKENALNYLLAGVG